MSEVAIPESASAPDITDETAAKVLVLRESLDQLTPSELHAAILWAHAVSAAGKAKRAWKLAREAAELQVHAERQLGAYVSSGMTTEEILEQYARVHGTQPTGRPREQDPATVEYIQQLHREGLSYAGIATRLNDEGVPSPRGGRWHHSGVMRVVHWGERRTLIDPTNEGAYAALAAIPEDLFNAVVKDLLDRGRSVEARVVIKIARLQSLEHVEPGISRSWDGHFYTFISGRAKRSTKRTIEEVREELYEQERLTTKKVRSRPAQEIDAAFAEARRDAQALMRLRESGLYPEVREIIGEAELQQAKVASLLYEAYREFRVLEKRNRPFRMPPK